MKFFGAVKLLIVLIACSIKLSFAFGQTTDTHFIFVEGRSVYLEQKGELASADRVSLPSGFSPADIADISGTSSSFCQKALKIEDSHIKILASPADISTQQVCLISFQNRTSSTKHAVRFFINRTFASWCHERSRHSPEANKTVDAMLGIFSTKECRTNILSTLSHTKMINLASKGIRDLSPLGSLVSLKSVWLENNRIENITPLVSLRNLMFLSLTHNHIRETHSFAQLAHLRWLFLGYNNVDDISFLPLLKELRFLDVSSNRITNYQPIITSPSQLFIVSKQNPFVEDFCRTHLKKPSDLSKLPYARRVQTICSGEEPTVPSPSEGAVHVVGPQKLWTVSREM